MRFGKEDLRIQQAMRAVFSGLLSKGVNLLVTLILVPLVLHTLGTESYGVWVIITSCVSMFFLLDLGIANTLTNLIAESAAANDHSLAGEYVSSALATVCGVSTTFALIILALWHHVDWPSLLHITTPALRRETPQAIAIAAAVLLLSLPAGLAARVFAGFQELHLSNRFTAAGSVGSLLFVLLAIHLQAALPGLVAAYAMPMVSANVLAFCWLVLRHKRWLRPTPRLVRRHHVKRILRTGGQFFALQLAGLIVMNSDNLVLSHYLSPSAVTPYNTVWRLVGYVLAVQGLPMGAMWPALAEAYAQRDLSWIQTAYQRMRLLTLAIVGVATGTLLLFGKSIVRAWVGAAAVPGTLLLVLMCVWMCLCAVTVCQSNLMGAVSRVGRQAIFSSIATAVNLALSIWWVRTLGQPGVILATVVSYSVFVVAVQMHEVRGILRGDGLFPAGGVVSA